MYNDSEWQRTMRIRLDYNNVMADMIGDEHGIKADELTRLGGLLGEIDTDLASLRESGSLPYRYLLYQDISAVTECTENLQARFSTMVVIGIGGSALGAISLRTALCHPHHNELDDGRRQGMRLFVADNVDPDALTALFDIVEPQTTVFNVITKSGSTAETMSTLLLVIRYLKDNIRDSWRDHLIATTDPAKGDLRAFADSENVATLEVPDGVGGRFSVLSGVGLLPAAAAGIDIAELLAGAAAMDERLTSSEVMDSPAYVGAAIHHLAYNHEHPKPIAVMMPYVQALKDVSDWFRQLWAESLGKAVDLSGDLVNVGPTPVNALGVTDQHSQVQLYVEGPNDKLYTFVAADRFSHPMPFPNELPEYAATSYFDGATMEQLLRAERQATELALCGQFRPNMTLTLPEVRAFTVGQLLYMLEVQTLCAGALFNVDPLDQPGVEAGKTATYALMGREGYEAQAAQIRSEQARRKDDYRLA